MSLLIWDRPDPVAAWVAARIPHVDEFGPCKGAAVIAANKMVAGVVFHDYQPQNESVQISMAADSPLWARKTTIAELLHYPFEQLDCYKVWTATPIDNTMALRVNEHIGFTRS